MKRSLLCLVVTLCTVTLLRADQAIRSLQQTLKDRGFYYGAVTGDKSAETTAAIRRYQIRNGLKVTGDIAKTTLPGRKKVLRFVEPGGAFILRLWETSGRPGPLPVSLTGYRKAVQTDLLERDLGPLAIREGQTAVPIKRHGLSAMRLVP